MRVGFTGTRSGLTAAQEAALEALLLRLDPEFCHHGDCVGADVSFHNIARKQDYKIIVHPPIDDKYRAYCTDAFEMRPPMQYLVRNWSIVESTEVLIACPSTGHQKLRSGTWWTYRKAKMVGRPIYLIRPNGLIQDS